VSGQIKEVIVFGEAPGATSYSTLIDNDGKVIRE
jgi:hypothetical protein